MSGAATFTEGPWYIEEDIAGHDYVRIIGAVDGDANDDGTPRMICTHVADILDNEDEQPNARLIAAAPDLYKALKDLRASFITAWGFEPDESSIHGASLKNAAAALAKVQP